MVSRTPLADRLDVPVKIQNKNIIDSAISSTWRWSVRSLAIDFVDFVAETNGGDGLEKRLCVVGK